MILLLLLPGVRGVQAQQGAQVPQIDVWSMAISKDGKFLAAGAGWWDKPGEIGIWDLATRQPLRRYTESLGVASVAFSADGKLLASGSWNGHIHVRDWAASKLVADFAVPGVARIAFAPQGNLLASATENKTMQLWDPAQRHPLADLQGDLFRFHCVTFSPDGKRVAAGGGDWVPGGIAQVTIWDVASRKQVQKLVGHNNAILCVTYSPQGDRIATGATDRTVRLWDAETGVLLKTFAGHGTYVESVIFGPDGKTLISGCRDGKIRVWDIDRGQEINRIEAMRSVTPLILSPDRQHLFVGGIPKTLKLYDASNFQELAILWSGADAQKTAMNDLPETEYQKPSHRGSLAGALLACVAALVSLVVCLYALRRRPSGEGTAPRLRSGIVVLSAFAAVVFFVVALTLFWVRTVGDRQPGELTQAEKAVEKVRTLESDIIDAKSFPDLTDGEVMEWRDLPNLRHLNFDRTEISDKALRGLDRFPSLVTLSIGQTRVTDAGLANLENLTGLRELRLHKMPITDAGLKHLAGLNKLDTLYLDKTAITDAGLQYLAKLTNLQVLILDESAIADAGLIYLKDLTNLQKLSLWRTRVTDAGTIHFGPLRALKYLSLDETAVSDAGLDSLLSLSQLNYLSVWKTKISEEGGKNLKKRMPNLKINR